MASPMVPSSVGRQLAPGCTLPVVAYPQTTSPVMGGVVADFSVGGIRQEVAGHVDRQLEKHRKLFRALAMSNCHHNQRFRFWPCWLRSESTTLFGPYPIEEHGNLIRPQDHKAPPRHHGGRETDEQQKR